MLVMLFTMEIFCWILDMSNFHHNDTQYWSYAQNSDAFLWTSLHLHSLQILHYLQTFVSYLCVNVKCVTMKLHMSYICQSLMSKSWLFLWTIMKWKLELRSGDVHLDKIFTCIHRHQRILLTNDLLKIQLQFRPKLSSKNSFPAFGQGKWTVSGKFSLNGWRPRNAGKWVLESVAQEIGSSHKSDKISNSK